VRLIGDWDDHLDLITPAAQHATRFLRQILKNVVFHLLQMLS
jgi:hypothetical protein